MLAWTSNYTHYNVWNEITDQFQNVKGVTAEVWEGVNNCIPHLTGQMVT